jgi:hypothetical protein
MVQKVQKGPECPNALANLLQNLFSNSTKWNQEVAQSDDENGASRRLRRISFAATWRVTFGMYCEISFLEEWSDLVDDFRTFHL